MRIGRWLIGLGVTPLTLLAQATKAPSVDPPPDAQQIIAAVLPLPTDHADATRGPVFTHRTAGSFDPVTGTVAANLRPLSVIYIAGATPASTGLSDKSVVGAPWIMFPGTPKAHIMLVPKM